MSVRALVTGGTGVIGAWAVRALLEHGVEPVVFARGISQAGSTINHDLAVESVQGDLLDPLSFQRAVQSTRAEVIVHLASAKPWQVEKPWHPEPKPRLAMDQIVSASLNVLEVARTAGIRRVVYASSRAVYSGVNPERPGDALVGEEHARAPRTLYGIGKLTAEQLGQFYGRHFGLEFIALRFPNTFGPFKNAAADGPGNWIESAAAGRKVVLPPADYLDDYLYNKDVASGIVQATIAKKPAHWAFNIGAGENVSGADLARALRTVVPNAHVEHAASRVAWGTDESGERFNFAYDVSRAKRELGFEPKFWPLDAAFRDYLKEAERLRTTAGAG